MAEIPLIVKVLMQGDPRVEAVLRDAAAGALKLGQNLQQSAASAAAFTKIEAAAEDLRTVFGGVAASLATTTTELGATNTALKATDATLKSAAEELEKLAKKADEAAAAERNLKRDAKGAADAVLEQFEKTNAAGKLADSLGVQFREKPRAAAAGPGAADLSRALGAGMRGMREEVGELVDGFQGAALGLLAFGGAITAIGAKTVQLAGEFEVLRARLVTVFKDGTIAAQTMQSAIEFAAATPFDVKGIVTATVQLEVYGASSTRILPRVANLAAGMGRSIEDTALAVGKAYSGSLEGFEQLRNTFGITTAELVRFGAEVNAAGGLTLQTTESLNGAREALLKIIDLRFAGAIERQAKTLQGAASNMSDAFINAGAGIGQQFVPALTFAATVASGAANGFNALGASGQATVAWGGAAVAALALLGGTLAGVSAGAVALTFALGLGRALETARVAAVAFATSPLGLVLAGVAAVGALAGLAIADYEARMKSAGSAIADFTRQAQQSSDTWRQHRDVVNEAGKVYGAFIGAGRDVRITGEQTAEALKKIPAADLVQYFKNAGIGLEDFKKSLQDNQDQANRFRTDYLELKRILDLGLAGETAAFDLGAGTVDLVGDLERFRDVFGGRAQVSVDEFRRHVEGLHLSLVQLGQDRTLVEGLISVFESFLGPLAELERSASRLGDYLKFAGKADDIGSLVDALGQVNKVLDEAKQTLGSKGLPTDENALRKLLLDPKLTDDVREAVKTTLGLYADADTLTDKIATKQKQAAKDALQAEDLAFQKRRVLGQTSAADEEAHLKRKVATAQAGSQEEIAALQALATFRENAAKDAAAKAKASASETVSSFKDGILEQLSATKSLKGETEASAAEMADHYRQVVLQIDRWTAGNAKLLEQYPDLARQVAALRRQALGQVASSEAAVPGENLATLKNQIRDMMLDAETLPQKLASVAAAIDLVNAKRQDGAITAKAAEEAVLDLQRQQLSLQKQLAAAKLKDAQEIGQLEQGILQQQIDAMAAEVEAGRGNAAELARLRQELLQKKIEAVNAELDAAIKAGEDEVAARRKAQLKIQAILMDETARQKDELDKQTQQVEDAVSDQTAARDRIGGAASPLQSIEEAFGALALFRNPDFSLAAGARATGGGFGTTPARTPTPESVAAAAGVTPFGSTPAPPSDPNAPRPTFSGVSTINPDGTYGPPVKGEGGKLPGQTGMDVAPRQTTIIINGMEVKADMDAGKAAEALGKFGSKMIERSGMTSGKGAPAK